MSICTTFWYTNGNRYIYIHIYLYFWILARWKPDHASHMPLGGGSSKSCDGMHSPWRIIAGCDYSEHFLLGAMGQLRPETPVGDHFPCALWHNHGMTLASRGYPTETWAMTEARLLHVQARHLFACKKTTMANKGLRLAPGTTFESTDWDKFSWPFPTYKYLKHKFCTVANHTPVNICSVFLLLSKCLH